MRSIVYIPLVLLSGAAISYSAELNKEAVNSWDEYLQSAQAQMKERLQGGKPFLWAQERQSRMASVRSGKIAVEPKASSGRVEVNDAMIHHWVGAVFVPDITVDRVAEILDEYDRYQDFYKPAVVTSKLVSREGPKRVFSMRWERTSVVARNAIDADYEASYSSLGQDRWWSIARTTRVQEIEHPGQPDEHLRAVGTGAGYIWRLCSITRLMQLDHGVVVELEAIALSRDVPAGLGWLVNPIISRMSRNALMTTLEQTKDALIRSRDEHPLMITAKK